MNLATCAYLLFTTGSICSTVLLLHDCNTGAASIYVTSLLLTLSALGLHHTEQKNRPQ